MAARPNIILILADDHGYGDISAHAAPHLETPHMDRIAAEGIRFTRFYANSSVCSPSRATFLTGRISSQHGVHDWIRGGNVGEDAAAYLQDEVAYTDVLAAHGYAVGISGKWHLGNSQLVQHGFDH